jgi:hypothetical protein
VSAGSRRAGFSLPAMMRRTTLYCLNLPLEISALARQLDFLKPRVVKKSKNGRCAMAVALEINFALWLMIGCATAEAIQVVEYLN